MSDVWKERASWIFAFLNSLCLIWLFCAILFEIPKSIGAPLLASFVTWIIYTALFVGD